MYVVTSREEENIAMISKEWNDLLAYYILQN